MTQSADPNHLELTPSERLSLTRRDIVSFMKQDKPRRPSPEQQAADRDSEDLGGNDTHDEFEPGDDDSQLGGTWQTIKHTVGAWWHAHPARLALDVAEPVMRKYAKAHPIKLLAIAAGVGATVVLARPWRLVSITGLAVAALKSSQLSAMAASMLTPKDKP